jgi:hypothetical protein
MSEETELGSLLSVIMGYAFIGQAAFIGMFLSGILILISLLGPIGFSPLAGFITVPLACVYLGIKGLKKNEASNTL